MTGGGAVVGENSKVGYNRFLLLVAGLGGLLYGVDVGIIGGALPYLQDTSPLTAGQLSIIVAAVLLGSVISTLFAGLLADWMGRKPLMILSGLCLWSVFLLSRFPKATGPSFSGVCCRASAPVSSAWLSPLSCGMPLRFKSREGNWNLSVAAHAWYRFCRLGGYLFQCSRGRSRQARRSAEALKLQRRMPGAVFSGYRMPPGILFVDGSFLVAESPRWLFRRGKKEAALNALLRSRSTEQAQSELHEMEEIAAAERASSLAGKVKESLLRRKYVIPFILACIILACNQTTGINSILGFNTNILLQGGLPDVQAHWGYVIFSTLNFLFTMVGVLLVDRKGRKFLLSMGTAGVILALSCTGILFQRTEKLRMDASQSVQAMVTPDQKLSLQYDDKTAAALRGSESAAVNAKTHPSASSILMAIFTPPQRLFALMTSRQNPSRSTARAPFPPTKSSPSSAIPSVISTRRAMRH